MNYRAADIVLHRPSGEYWQLAVDEEDGHVYPCGWPPTRANAADCEPIRTATDDARLAQLQMSSEIVGSDSRANVAQRQLRELEGL